MPHPGVGREDSEDPEGPVLHHAYYQWVWFVLFAQGLMFFLPHRLWRHLEGGTVKSLVDGLEYGYLALADDEAKASTWPCRPKYLQKVELVRKFFTSRRGINKSWGCKLILCEVLNAANTLAQVYFTDFFLGGRFLSLGPALLDQTLDEASGPLDVVFPKMTKCTFRKYGATGDIQTHDALCIMPLNVVNEKIYTCLWFWFAFVCPVTVLGLAWRVVTLLLYKRSAALNRVLFDQERQLDVKDLLLVVQHCHYSEWLLLLYVCSNMHIHGKSQLFNDLAEDIRMSADHRAPPASRTPAPSTSTTPIQLTLDEPDGGVQRARQRATQPVEVRTQPVKVLTQPVEVPQFVEQHVFCLC